MRWTKQIMVKPMTTSLDNLKAKMTQYRQIILWRKNEDNDNGSAETIDWPVDDYSVVIVLNSEEMIYQYYWCGMWSQPVKPVMKRNGDG